MSSDNKRTIRCPQCRAKLLVSPSRSRVVCPKCQKDFAINSIGTTSSVAAIPKPAFPEGDELAGDPGALAPEKPLNFYAYYVRHWSEVHGSTILQMFPAVFAGAGLSLLKPAILPRGMILALVGTLAVAVLAFVVYSIQRVLAYTLGGERHVDEGTRSALGWLSHFGVMAVLLVGVPLVSVEYFTPDKGLLATLVPPLAEPQAQVLARFGVKKPPEAIAANPVPPAKPDLAASPDPVAKPDLKKTRDSVEPEATHFDMTSGERPADASPRASAAGSTPDTMVVVSEGVGETAEEATRDAYRNAVRQVVGVVVDAETLVKNDEVISDKVLTYSDGFIEKAETIGESRQGGLSRRKIRATIKRRGVIARLKEASIFVATVDGQSIHAEAVTQLEAEKNAVALSSNLFQGYPESVLKAEVTEKPEIADKSDARVTLRYQVRLRFDTEKFDEFFRKALPTLEKIAVRKGDWDLVAESPGQNNRLDRPGNSVTLPDQLHVPEKNYPSADARGKRSLPWQLENLDTKTNMALLVNTQRNRLNDRTTWRWFHVARPKSLAHPVKIKVEFLDKDAKILSRDVIVTSEDPNHGLIELNLRQGIVLRSLLFPVLEQQVVHGKEWGFRQIAVAAPDFITEDNQNYYSFVRSVIADYSATMILNREFSFTPDELAAMTTIRCSVSAAD